LLVGGERAEECVDRQAKAVRGRRLEQMERAAQDRQVLVRRDHVHVIGLDLHPILDLDDRHRRRALEQLDQHALVIRVEVLDDDEGGSALGRCMLQKEIERFEAAGRRPDTDNRDMRVRGGLHDDGTRLRGLGIGACLGTRAALGDRTSFGARRLRRLHS